MNKALVVVGTQWGDEGKGKITNYLSELADVVVRYQGGDNAGHTIKFNNQTYALHLIPSGVFNENIKNIIGNGVVLNPKTFMQEVTTLKSKGIKCNNLYISDRAHVIFDYHQAIDGLEEKNKKDKMIGTTKKGIGPAYTDKSSRIGIRVCDFISNDFKNKYYQNVALKNELLKANDEPLIDIEASFIEYSNLAKMIRPFVTDTVSLINEEYNKGSKILFEGAQGVLLDIDFGTYPFVTSSNPATGATSGVGLGPTKIGEIVGIVKAYSTRVGSGVFPTELFDDLAHYIRERGHEYGTTTHRPRRVGYFDAVIVKYSAMVCGLTDLSLMLLDVLSGVKELKVCTSYLLDGKEITTVPAKIEDFERCIPVYETVPGFDEDISNIKEYEKLPENAIKYIELIEKAIGVNVSIVSVGPDREQTILRKKFFKNE